MTHFGIDRPQSVDRLPCPRMDSLSFSLSRSEEQAFIRGCEALLKGREEMARRHFRTAANRRAEFMDAWFMLGFIELANGRAENARQAFLHILQDDKPFFGFYVLRFLPTFRPHVNLFEDFLFHIMPTTPDVAAATARLYLIEDRNREAKKIIHPAFREYPDNPAVQAVWGQSMLADDSPDPVINEVDRRLPFHRGKNELDILVTHVIGAAYLAKGDFRSGVSHWESIMHQAIGKNPRLFDRFRILLAKQYEKKGFLIDAIEVLGTVQDHAMPYEPDMTVDFKRGQLVERINTFSRSGIVRPLQFHSLHEYPRWRPLPKYLELRKPEGMIP